MKKLISALRFAALGLVLLSATHTARAGYWVVDRYIQTSTAHTEFVYATFPSPQGGPGSYKKGTDGEHPDDPDEESAVVGWRTRYPYTTPFYIVPTTTPPSAQAHISMETRAVFKWISSSGSGTLPDPPSQFVSFVEISQMIGYETRYHATGEHVEYSQMSNGLGNEVTDSGYDEDGVRIVQASGINIKTIDSNGQTEVFGPTRTLSGIADMDATYPTEEYDSSGDVNLTPNYRVSLLQLTPDPNGLPVMACPPNLKTLNQYVMNGTNGVPFVIDCRAEYEMADSSYDNAMRDGFSWDIARPPLPMLATAPNKLFRSYYGNYVSINRRSYPPDPNSPIPGATPTSGPTPLPTATPVPGATPTPTPSATPIDGMGFDTRGGLPSSTYAFGPNTIFHQFADSTTAIPKIIASADIALFYEAAATTHPYGGPKGYYFNVFGIWAEVDTPNWFYYYNQAYSPPCPVQYAPHPGGRYGYYTHGDPFVRLCNAYGTKPTVLFRKINGNLTVVGREIIRGIDTYARVLAHENAHRRCYEAIENGMPDTDEDGVPDPWEITVGMKIQTNTDSTGFIAFYGTYPPSEAESESFARLYEEGVVGPLEGDWAADTTPAAKFGLNWASPPAPNRCLRTALQDINRQPTTSVPGDIVTNKP